MVLRYEKERLSKLGRPDLAERVRWHAQEREFLGWDITSFEEDGGEVFIEVKSSVGQFISAVNLTVNEWQAACEPTRRERYYIYIVTGALSSEPVIERLRNPASFVDRKELLCNVVVYELRLREGEAFTRENAGTENSR